MEQDQPTKNVPDTLDLADHGRMAINGMLGSLDPALDYECVFLNILDVHPAYMLHWSSMVSGVMPKYVEALPLLRLMSGSDQQMDLQNGFVDAMLRNMSEDGLVYDRALPSRPWNVGVGYGRAEWNEDYANMAGNGRMLVGLTYWYQATGDEKWKGLAKKSAERMLELAVVKGDIGFYPNPGLGNDFSYPRKTGWTHANPPERSNEGFEGATLFYLCQPLKGFAHYSTLTGDERFLQLSRKFVNLALQSKFWGAAHDMNQQAAAERGHFQGHFHGRLSAARGLLDFALVANDANVKLFVRDVYEWARQHGIHRLGVFPHGDVTEGCTIGDMTGLAVALTDAGLGDYWDDVEQYARNGLIETQFTDLDELVRVAEAGRHRPENSNWGGSHDWRKNKGQMKGQEVADRVLERSIGAFGHLDGASNLRPLCMHCCTANDSLGLYYAWEGIARHGGPANSGAAAEVNMWLNRRSPWVDVWSWLPHEGKLIVRNKGMKSILVRKPGWVRRAMLRCRINGRDVQPAWAGNRVLFTGLRGNEWLQFDVPLATDKATYSLVPLNDRQTVRRRYECEFRGNTAINVKAIEGGANRDWYRLFRREPMRADRAPTKAMAGYVHPDRLVRWLIL